MKLEKKLELEKTKFLEHLKKDYKTTTKYINEIRIGIKHIYKEESIEKKRIILYTYVNLRYEQENFGKYKE
jgi:hypothetical protein